MPSKNVLGYGMAKKVQNTENFSRKDVEELSVTHSVIFKKRRTWIKAQYQELLIGWMQIKTTKGLRHTIFKMPSVQRLQTMNADGLVEKGIPTMLLVGCKLVTAHHENRMELHLKGKN